MTDRPYTRPKDAGWEPAQLPESFTAKVHGVTFAPRYPDVLHELEALQLLDHIRTGRPPAPVPCQLRRNPDNEHDPNAIEVWAGPEGALGMAGHLPANVARWLSGVIDRGAWYDAELAEVRVHPHGPNRPGMMLRLRLRAEVGRDDTGRHAPGVRSRA